MKNLYLFIVCIILVNLSSCRDGTKKKSGPDVFEPTWESLTNRELPEWIIDAKFGIYAHWGVYSVPAYGNEWYARRMYNKNDEVYRHHIVKYGDPSEFGYKDFIPLFKAENYDPGVWADLIAASGAKYAGIAVVHHDGFLLWNSKVNRWNAVNMGPERDLYGDLVTELRKKPGMKIIATFHHIRTFNWYLPDSTEAREEGRNADWDLFDKQYADLYWNEYTSNFEDFVEEWKAKVKEVIDNYQPDVIWFDGGKFQDTGSQQYVLDVLSYYLNRGRQWDKTVEVLNKLPGTMNFNFPMEFGILTFEEGRDRPAIVYKPWIDDMKISTDSWGYISGQEYKTANEIIDGLIDRVARGGGLLLSLCPLADGTLNQSQKDILLSIGKWLNVNGEAIYETRPWKIHAEGDESKLRTPGRNPQQKHLFWKFDRCDASDIRFTRSKDGNTLYAIALGWPENGRLVIQSLNNLTKISEEGIESIVCLANQQQAEWSRDNLALYITILEGIDRDGHAFAFRINLKGKLLLE